jgi:hypothetical protein
VSCRTETSPPAKVRLPDRFAASRSCAAPDEAGTGSTDGIKTRSRRSYSRRFASAGAGEANVAVLMQPVRLVEERGHLLHFVDHYLPRPACRGQLAAQRLRVLEVAAVNLQFAGQNPSDVPQPDR